MTMHKYNLEYLAASKAIELETAYGFSVLGGSFYVGTVNELKAVGFFRIEDSTPIKGCKGRF